MQGLRKCALLRDSAAMMRPRPDAAVDTAVEHALARERVRNIRFINLARLLTLLAVIALESAFHLSNVGYVGGSLAVYLAWFVAAGVAFVAARRSTSLAHVSGYFTAIVDMPLLYLVIRDVGTQLIADGYAQDARSTAAAISIFYGVMVVLGGALLDRLQVLVGGVLALILVALVQTNAGLAVPVTAFTCVALLFALAVAVAIGSRSHSLVAAVTAEELQRQRLGRYFSPQVAARLAEAGDQAGRGESHEVTVLFSDLRDFTALAESMPGPEVVALLNEIDEVLVEEIFRHGGTLDKYTGDGVMAYFGAPAPQPDHAAAALRCAAAMLAGLESLNDRRRQRGETVLRIGIGLHSGRVIMGDIGAARRREFTIVGHTVNIAARLEQLTKEHGVPILVSEETQRASHNARPLREVATTTIRGQSAPLRIYTLDTPTV